MSEYFPQYREHAGSVRLLASASVLALALSGCTGSDQEQSFRPEQRWPGASDTSDKQVLAIVSLEGDGPALEYKAPLSEEIKDGLHEALEEDIVRYVTTAHSLELRVVEGTHDNGFAYFGDNSVDIQIGSKDGKIFTNKHIFGQVMVHEVIHHSSEDWYKNLRDNDKGPSTNREKRLNVIASCQPYRDHAFRTFIKDNRQDISNAFTILANGITYNDDPLFKASLKEVATAVSQNDAMLYQKLGEENSCAMPELEQFTSFLGKQQIKNPPPILTDLTKKLNTLAADDFTCVTDEAFTADLYKTKPKKSQGDYGHPWDNPTEFTSSLVSALRFNPSYVQRCMDKLPPNKKQDLQQYAGAVLALTDVKVKDILAKDDTARNLMNAFANANNNRDKD